MNPTLVMIISMVVVIAVYVIIAELYTTFRSSAYIGTAALVIALYFANDVFVNSHPQWPWLVIVLACLLVAEIITGLLSRYHKTNVGLIMLSCAIVGMSAFKILSYICDHSSDMYDRLYSVVCKKEKHCKDKGYGKFNDRFYFGHTGRDSDSYHS